MKGVAVALECLDRFAQRWVKDGRVPGLAIAVTSRDRTIEVLTYGSADVAARTPVGPETLFEIGSLGKPFTSMALLQLCDEGELDLARPISDYLPWFEVRSPHPPITAHHLLNHTAGIIRGTERASHGLYDCWALRELEVSAAPGEHFCYSSLGYKALGFLLEELTGLSYAEAIRSRILDPLGMTRTHAVSTARTRLEAATGHCGLYDDRPEHPTHPVVSAPWEESGAGDGCQASTVGDMTRYLRLLLNRGRGPAGRVLSERGFDRMTSRDVWTGGDYYGFGLATYDDGGRRYIGHGGGNAGFRSAIVVDMEAGLGVVFLLNRMGETDPVVAAAQHALTLLRAAQRGEALPPPPEAAPHAVADAEEYAGRYRSDAGELRLTAKGDALLLDSGAARAVPLERRGPDRFYVPHPDFELALLELRRQDGRVAEAFHGPRWYAHDRYRGPGTFEHPGRWEAYVGHYRTRNPELSNFRVVLRKGSLALIIPWGDSYSLHPIGESRFRIGDDPLSPETLCFGAVVAGRSLRADYSGCPYYRAFTP